MIEIKFRAWDKHNKKWITEPLGFTMSVVDGKFHIFGFDGAFADMYQVRTELQQYTGLRDKNGKEIYEGDIVKVSKDYILSSPFKIVFEQACFVAESLSDPLASWVQLARLEDIEIIGNIDENPELLEGKIV